MVPVSMRKRSVVVIERASLVGDFLCLGWSRGLHALEQLDELIIREARAARAGQLASSRHLNDNALDLRKDILC